MTTPSHHPHQQVEHDEHGQPGGGPLVATVMAPDQQRLWAVLGHLSPLLTGFVGPLVLFVALKDRGSFVRRHVAGALNAQLTLALVPLTAFVVGTVLAMVASGTAVLSALPLVGAYLLAVLVMQVLSAVRAHRGLGSTYPLTLRLVR